MKSPCFGIDLGTSCSAIGWVEDGAPRLIPIDGQQLLPSVVSFLKDQPVLVGHSALNSLHLHPEETVLSSKRKMGSNHVYDLGHRTVTPVDVAAEILKYLVKGAEEHTGVKPERVVITVPAWFTQAQRADTKRAGEQAGLEVVRIINEPTAAALAHAHGQEINRSVLVYDFGGGTFDVSLVQQDGPVIEVRASHGDSNLGGDDVDRGLMDYVLRKLASDDVELREAIDNSRPARVKLRAAVEACKITLSESLKTTLAIPYIVEIGGQPRHLEMEITRAHLDAIAEPLINRTLKSVDQVFQDSGILPNQIDDLFLVGGSTHLPQVWHRLKTRYHLEGSHAIPPQKVVALGAAIQAAIVDGSRTDGILIDVAPYPVAIGAATGMDPNRPDRIVSQVITPRNAPLPSRHTEIFYTAHAQQKTLIIPVFQGSHIDPRQNVYLGEIVMDDLEPAPDGYDRRPISVEFRHNLDGMVDITVNDQLSGRSVSGQVAADGAEQVELRDAWMTRVKEGGDILFGDGSDSQVLPEDTLSTGGYTLEYNTNAPAALPGEHVTNSKEARQTFDAILAAAEQIKERYPDQLEKLLQLSREGLAALEAGSDAVGIERFEELSDEMFDLGLYL